MFQKNQEIYLKDILVPSISQTNHKPVSCGQVYGCLVNSQIVPLQYFQTRAERYASCSYMNMIPVWKTIAEGQLRKVDAYVLAMDNVNHPYNHIHSYKYVVQLIHHLKNFQPFRPYTIYGVSGVLKMKKTTNPNEFQKIFLSDSTTQKIIPIPKIIYRIIDHHCFHPLNGPQGPYNFKIDRYAAAIIIHNDPSPISDEDRLCSRESALSSWHKITNEDSRTGVTYVCPVTVELNDMLGAYDNMTSDTFRPLDLNTVPYSYLSHWGSNGPMFYKNYTSKVDVEFERILRAEFA